MAAPKLLLPGLLVSVAGVFVLFALAEDYREEILFGVSALGGTAALLTAYLVAATLRDTNAREKMEHAFEFTRIFNSPEMTQRRDLTRKAIANRHSSLHKAAAKDTELKAALNGVLGMFEELAIAIKERHTDEAIAYRFFSGAVPWAAVHLGDYIRAERDDGGDSRNYAELLELGAAWSARRSVLTGRAMPDAVVVDASQGFSASEN